MTDAPQGSVLVATTLAPGLGPVLPRLNGIVAETGSVLSRLAILAREFGVPIVAGYPGATTAFRTATSSRSTVTAAMSWWGRIGHEGGCPDRTGRNPRGRRGVHVVSLNRWEWNRALLFALIVLMAEVALASALILSRLSRLTAALEVDPSVLDILRETRPPQANRFEWLERASSRTNVFIIFLVGGGVLLSAAAWIVDHLASRTVTRVAEARLTRQLRPIGYPPGGLLVDDMTVLAQAVPGCDDGELRALLRRRGTRPELRYVAIVAAVVLAAVGILLLRDATLSTHERVSADSSIEVLIRVRSHGAERDQSLAALGEALLLTCQLEVNSDLGAPIEPLPEGYFRAVLRPSMDASDRRQFRGCVQDWSLDHVRIDVIRLDDLQKS